VKGEVGRGKRDGVAGGGPGDGKGLEGQGGQRKALKDKGKTAHAGGNCMSHAKTQRRKELRTACGQDEQDLQDGEPRMHAHGREWRDRG